MKRITTKELLASSFLELSEKKPINKITIANIVENCELTQPTFYRHFKDKYDMMIWIYVKEIGKSFEKIGTDKHEWKDTIIDGVVYFTENKKFLINALKHTSGRDSFLWQMSKMNIEFMENEIKKRDAYKRMLKRFINSYMQDEDEDANWMEEQLELIELIGKQNWLVHQL